MVQRHGLYDDTFDFIRDFDDLHREMDLFRGLPAETLAPHGVPPACLARREFLPAVECFMKDSQLILRVELPGVDPKDVEVCIIGDQLVLRGDKKDERQVDAKDLLFREIRRGRFERSFSLPAGIRADQIKATYDNGVLTVVLPAGSIEAARRVPIEIAGGGGKPVKAA